ncbi:thrombomodulin-like [Rhinoderma darwinii]|uniref:thrombomodulin-like n=1 Tax=Rhinoderma darwinii TaxID=43563 RepID=UPI003F66CC9F
MQLYYFTCSALVFAQLAQVALQEELQSEFVCLDMNCYSVSWNNYRSAKSRQSCKEKNGDLMTVKSSVQADVIAMFMAKSHKEDARVWIGLEHPHRTDCTDLQQPLRGFTWVTGDSNTDYTNWKNNEKKCGALCVTVRKDGTWEETDCGDKPDGYLCEITYSLPCFPLVLPSSSYNVSYYHPSLGIGHTGSPVFPPGTIADISSFPNIMSLSCEEKGNGIVTWSSETPGAWSCLIEKGGCENECVEESDTAKCKCPSGSELKADHRSCTKPCDPSPCSQHCALVSDPPGFQCMCSEGYIIAADGKTCEDIDDCAASPYICEHHCTNTFGGFVCDCKPGFEMVNVNCSAQGDCVADCKDIDECETSMCEHECKNYEGGHKCVCHEGFVIDENNLNKCKQFCNTASCKADCNAGKSCRCPPGYIVDQNEDGDNICTDVDECDAFPCDGLCVNTFGSFLCTCPENYTIHNDESIPPTAAPSDIPLDKPPSTSRPADIYSLQPTIMWGIGFGVLSMFIVLIAMLCYRMRRHYIYQHDLDYNYKNIDKDVVLKKIMMEPHWRL